MSAQSSTSPQQFWWLHGTAHEFQPGDMIDPAHSGQNEFSRVKKDHTYFTGDQHAAQWYARRAVPRAERLGDTNAAARVYAVEPTGPVEDDPDNETMLGDSSPTMTKHPLRVHHLVTHQDRYWGAKMDEWTPGDKPLNTEGY